jgi:ubiquinone/menaquinone biosynthesis C-methylase UbiE
MKSRVAKGFDFLAPFYDRLARVMIGNDIVLSQVYFLEQLKKCKRLLILGGGSGWILNDICGHFPNLEIDYVDLSPAMIKRARKGLKYKSNVNFIQGTEDNLRDYDGVITNFFLDMFDDKGVNMVIEKIKRSLRHDAIWLVTDFVNERKRHRVKLWWMYRFFGMVATIEAVRLPDWRWLISEVGFELLESRKFNDGFIASHIYQFVPESHPDPSSIISHK